MSEEVTVGWGNQRVIENSEMCGDLVVSEATHSQPSEPRGELGSGTDQQVWEPMLGLYGECRRESLVVFEGPQTSVCPRVAYCPRVSGKQEDWHTPVVFHPQFPGNTSFEYHSQAEMPGLAPGPAVLLPNSPSLATGDSEQGCLRGNVFSSVPCLLPGGGFNRTKESGPLGI